MAGIMRYNYEKGENIVGKGGNARYQHFHLFPQYLQNTAFQRLIKHGIEWLRVKSPNYKILDLLILNASDLICLDQ